jgi:hypothetical protein
MKTWAKQTINYYKITTKEQLEELITDGDDPLSYDEIKALSAELNDCISDDYCRYFAASAETINEEYRRYADCCDYSNQY